MKYIYILIPLILLYGLLDAKEKVWKSNMTWGYLQSDIEYDRKLSIQTKTANYNMAATDYMILVDASSNTVNVKMPNPTLVTGLEYVIKATNIDNAVNIIPFGSETFDGADNINLIFVNSSVIIISTGTNWVIK